MILFLLMSLTAFRCCNTTAYEATPITCTDGSGSEDKKICVYACPADTKSNRVGFLGIDVVNEGNKNFAVCAEEPNWETPAVFCDADTTDTQCPEFSNEGMKDRCNATQEENFCSFECKDNYVSNPYLRYSGMEEKAGKVMCADQWLTNNTCLKRCAMDEKPYIDNCVCEIGHGANATGFCEACADGTYSKGVETCKACRDGQAPKSDKSDCEWIDGTPKICGNTNQLEGVTNDIGGRSVDGFRYFNTEDINCADGHTKLDIKRSVCYPTGELSATVYCSKQCPTFVMKNAADNEDGEAQDYGSTQVYTCLDNFGVNKDKSVTSETAICTLGGIWYHPGHCEPVMKKKSWLWLIILLSVVGVCIGVGLVLFFVLR